MREQENGRSIRYPRWLLIIGVLVLLGVAFFLGRGTGSSKDPDGGRRQHASDAANPSSSETGESLYYCSMHPSQRSTDADATCPICGMDLVPMPEDVGTGDLPVLKVSERSAALMNIEVTPVERHAVEVPVRFVGTLQADETLLRDVVVRSDSYVEKLHANYKWRHVQKGELLAEVYSPKMKAAARELLVIARGERTNKDALKASRAKLRRLGMPSTQIDEILAKREVPHTYEIRSPIGGHLMSLSGRQGHWLKEGERLVQVMNPSNLWARLEAYESDLQWVEVGDRVEVTAPQAFPGDRFKGEVTFIEPHVDNHRRTAEIRLNVANPDGRLKPGTFIRATVQADLPAHHKGFPVTEKNEPADESHSGTALVIPDSAPLITGKRALVYVKSRESEIPTYEGREVILGPDAGDYYLVRDGLKEGELVVSRGAFMIDSELQIRGRPSMMQPEDETNRATAEAHAH